MNDFPTIELKDITVIYNEGTPNQVVALDKISFIINKHETVLISGGNGSGKSTLLKVIAGTAPIKSGEILLNGIDVTSWPAYKRAHLISFVHQDPLLGTCPNLTVFENLQVSSNRYWWLPILNRYSFDLYQRQLLARTGLPLIDKISTPMNLLSGGQRQAVSICLALRSKRQILLLDEFTSALDESTSTKMMSYLDEMYKISHFTLLNISHRANYETKKYNRLIKLVGGKLVE